MGYTAQVRCSYGWIVVLGCLSTGCTFGSEASTTGATEATGSSTSPEQTTDESTASPMSNGTTMTSASNGTATSEGPVTGSTDDGPATGPGDDTTSGIPPVDDPYRSCAETCPKGFDCAQAGACAQPCRVDPDCPAPIGGTSEPLCATEFEYPFCVLPCDPQQCPDGMTCVDFGQYQQCGYGDA